MSEGSLEAPQRRPIPWQDADFVDGEKLDAELRRVFDICHGCRRCFNLCDSFPRLFDLIDDSDTGELDSVASVDFKPVADACTLCDMCFMTKCPYVPPHEFDIDFPHLMLCYRAAEAARGSGAGFTARQLTETDRDGRLGCGLSGLANWATDTGNGLTRPIMQAVAGVHRDAALPRYESPQLERGDIGRVADNARRIAADLGTWIDRGYEVVALVPSCTLMLKFEWPLIVPDDATVGRLAAATRHISEYVADIARTEGLAPGLEPLDGDVTVHIACHARAQNMGRKAAEMLDHLPETKVTVIERCSGHGGAWGVMKENFEVALKIGKPVARQAAEAKARYLVSECPLARDHIVQGIERADEAAPDLAAVHQPIELLALAYGEME